MKRILDQMFSWPYGIVVGNLIASFLIWFPHTIYMHWRLNKHVRSTQESLSAMQQGIDIARTGKLRSNKPARRATRG